MLLADLGAEVIKIEDPRTGGDTARHVPPDSEEVENDSLYFQSMNRNKRSLTLNLRSEEGRSLFRRLVRVSDVVYNNLRGDQPAKLGLRYVDLHHENPRIVCAACSGYGTENSKAAEPGYDFIMQALTGYMALTGEPEAPPSRCGVSVIDFSAGLVSLVGMFAALRRMEETGRGGDADTSLFEGAFSMLNYLAAWRLNLGFEPARRAFSAHQSVVPVQIFPTRDGWIFIMCMKDKFFEELCERIGRGTLPSDPRFADMASRFDHQGELVALLSETLRKGDTADWLEALRGALPCAPVYDLEQALEDPFVSEAGLLWDVEHPTLGRLREIGCPIRLSNTEELPRRPAPALGGDTEALLAELLELDATQVAALRENGVV
jgi:crotonobetainyl-CoA:carnitine CoA-transferase CaiB-like acyl-CoA transferase